MSMSFVLFFSFDVTFDFLSVSSHTCPFPKRKKENKKNIKMRLNKPDHFVFLCWIRCSTPLLFLYNYNCRVTVSVECPAERYHTWGMGRQT